MPVLEYATAEGSNSVDLESSEAMKKTIRILAAGAVGLALTAGAAQAQDDAEAVIKSRMQVMQIFQASLVGISNVVQGKVNAPQHMANYANALASVGPLLPDLYPAGTGPESGIKTRALATIWDDPDGFRAAQQTSGELIAALVTAAESGDPAATGAALGALGKDGCTACHTKYRAK